MFKSSTILVPYVKIKGLSADNKYLKMIVIWDLKTRLSHSLIWIVCAIIYFLIFIAVLKEKMKTQVIKKIRNTNINYQADEFCKLQNVNKNFNTFFVYYYLKSY